MITWISHWRSIPLYKCVVTKCLVIRRCWATFMLCLKISLEFHQCPFSERTGKYQRNKLGQLFAQLLKVNSSKGCDLGTLIWQCTYIHLLLSAYISKIGSPVGNMLDYQWLYPGFHKSFRIIIKQLSMPRRLWLSDMFRT